MTTKQVQRFLDKKQVQQAQQRLNTLLSKEYIGRRYSNEDKLLGRYAVYYMLPKGLDLLKGYGDKKALRLMRKDPTASKRFIDHSIAIGEVAAELKRIYSKVLTEVLFLTKTDMLKVSSDQYDGSDDFEFDIDSYPEPLPDGFIDGWPIDYQSVDLPNFFIEVWHDTIPFWVYRKRIQYLIEYTDDGIWKDAFYGADTPPFLIVCDTPTLQRRTQRYLRRIYESTSSDYQFLVTNRQLLTEANDDNAIWTRVDDERTEVLKLTHIP